MATIQCLRSWQSKIWILESFDKALAFFCSCWCKDDSNPLMEVNCALRNCWAKLISKSAHKHFFLGGEHTMSSIAIRSLINLGSSTTVTHYWWLSGWTIHADRMAVRAGLIARMVHHRLAPSDSFPSKLFILLDSKRLGALKSSFHGNSKPPWGISNEYCLGPFTTHVIEPPLLMKTEHRGDIHLDTCPTIVLLQSISFLIATASDHANSLLRAHKLVPPRPRG